jgi:DNA-binding LacI/PurR family transcriptional regulator
MSTIYQVAEVANVSPKTAARILSGASKRSKHKDRVFAAAAKLGYVRNQQAANLRSGSSQVIGIVVPGINNPTYGQIIQAMHDACLKEGFSILLSCSFGNPDDELRALQTLQTYRADGVMLNSSELSASPQALELCQRMLDAGKPVIFSGVSEPGIPADMIGLHNEAAVAKAVRYLIAKGHRRIGFVGGRRETVAMKERHAGYLKALAEAGLQVPGDFSLFSDGSLPSVSKQVTRVMLQYPPAERPTAFVSGNDLLAIAAMRAIHQLSLKIPEQVAIVGFDDIDLAEILTPALTTLRQPQEQMALDCTKLMIERIRSKDVSSPQKLMYEPELVIRDSA